MHKLRRLEVHRSMASLMISEMLFDVVFVSFSRDFFSLSFMRSDITFCNGSIRFLFFLDEPGSLETRSPCVMCRNSLLFRGYG
jgi:hypothetical protein